MKEREEDGRKEGRRMEGGAGMEGWEADVSRGGHERRGGG